MAGTLRMFEEGVERILDGEEFRRFLRVQRRFTTYSARNALLVMVQRPDASRVAGYRAWRELGRQVKKGEKGIEILAPVTRKERDEESGEEVRVVSGFRTVHVWAYEQTFGTTGEELPGPPAVEDLGAGGDTEREAAGRLYERLLLFCGSEGVEVREGFTGPSYGYYSRPHKRIVISSSLAELDRASTLAHELAHYLLHEKLSGDRRREEIEAEGTAFCLFDHYGLDTGRFSFGYVARYAGNTEAVKRAIEGIQRASRRLIEGVEGIPERAATTGAVAEPTNEGGVRTTRTT